MRALYKDLVQLIVHNDLISSVALKTKLEDRFNGDRLTAKGEKTNGREYREERNYENHQIKFKAFYFFITCCYNERVEQLFNRLDGDNPDVIVYNSCLWDISRWGPNSIKNHIKVFPEFVDRLKTVLQKYNCYFIWLTTLPISEKIKGGFLLNELRFLENSLRFAVIQANKFTTRLMIEAGFDVLDMHYYLIWHNDKREEDGVHWQPAAYRYITNLILTRITLAWNASLPNNFSSKALEDLSNEDSTKSFYTREDTRSPNYTAAPHIQNFPNFLNNSFTENVPAAPHIQNFPNFLNNSFTENMPARTNFPNPKVFQNYENNYSMSNNFVNRNHSAPLFDPTKPAHFPFSSGFNGNQINQMGGNPFNLPYHNHSISFQSYPESSNFTLNPQLPNEFNFSGQNNFPQFNRESYSHNIGNSNIAGYCSNMNQVSSRNRRENRHRYGKNHRK